MSKIKETTSIKVDKEAKNEAKMVFAQLGMSMGEAVNIFLTQVALTKSIPFEIKIPNEETQQIMEEVLNNKNTAPLDYKELSVEESHSKS
ncbi:MAG: type II toxin-antitoxin system RelB/DinJ family antitoxin [Flexistipes sinusarabici]|uniref:Type II toxin-antitoxin system RelB/DinJ family antitoxin n=1 Tax=Flexistipes sinusarabici TaxID=2352 RepID=A0A5D0MQF0_FLESI|nr:type II toxin-antitoxin system RelB/DinJ family antitoxin [Flexistipes sinusarabici]TYB33913.1 MAG: type II toxin-antitoxin system RelB/DinJ family antitoxin [Flexistipes sinusarabici]